MAKEVAKPAKAPTSGCEQRKVTVYKTKAQPGGGVYRTAVMRKNPATGRVEPVTFTAGRGPACKPSAKVTKARANFKEAVASCIGEVGSAKKTFTPEFRSCMRTVLSTPRAAKPKSRGKKAK